MKHVARKRFGQHFLVDRSVIAAIVAAIAPQRGDLLVEIGPGLGALTDALVGTVDHLMAVELDRNLAARLRQRYGPERLTLIEADVLTVAFDAPPFGAGLRVAGNLPYNISSPLLVHLLDVLPAVRDQHFMLQKEVVERIVAPPGTTAYGRLGVLLQAYYDVELLFEVGPESFDPPPRVDSAVIRMIPLPSPAPVTPKMLSKVVAQAFSQRRKMLRNTFIPWLAQQGIDSTLLSPTDRAEDVPVAVYVALAGALQARAAGVVR